MDHKSKTIAELQEKLASIEREANKLKQTINLLYELDSKPPLYSDCDAASVANSPLKGDEYHNMPRATAITEILERRKAVNLTPVTIDEVYEDMIAGGFQFTKGKNEGIQKRGVAIAMSKNRKFYKLPNEKWGMKAWYNIPEQRGEANSSQAPEALPDDQAEGNGLESSSEDAGQAIDIKEERTANNE